MSTEFSRGELASQFDANMADRGFLQATAKSMGVIFASEIGDKTFFIAALMAMRHPRTLVRILGRSQPPSVRCTVARYRVRACAWPCGTSTLQQADRRAASAAFRGAMYFSTRF